MNLYTCTIHFQNRDRDEGESPDRIGSVTIAAKNERTAAAKAYFRLVGRHRVRKLKQLNAPSFIINYESDLLGLACGLVRKGDQERSRLYVHDNVVEAWDIEVEPASPAMERAYREMRQRPLCPAVCSAFRASWRPSVN